MNGVAAGYSMLDMRFLKDSDFKDFIDTIHLLLDERNVAAASERRHLADGEHDPGAEAAPPSTHPPISIHPCTA